MLVELRVEVSAAAALRDRQKRGEYDEEADRKIHALHLLSLSLPRATVLKEVNFLVV